MKKIKKMFSVTRFDEGMPLFVIFIVVYLCVIGVGLVGWNVSRYNPYDPDAISIRNYCFYPGMVTVMVWVFTAFVCSVLKRANIINIEEWNEFSYPIALLFAFIKGIILIIITIISWMWNTTANALANLINKINHV